MTTYNYNLIKSRMWTPIRSLSNVNGDMTCLGQDLMDNRFHPKNVNKFDDWGHTILSYGYKISVSNALRVENRLKRRKTHVLVK